jgi:hypothetical protein
MNLSPGTTTLTRDERILVLCIMVEQLKAEKRIDDWMLANPNVTIWLMPEGRMRTCTVIRDGVVIANSKGVDDDDARGQCFQAIFANEAAALAESE